MKIKGEIMKDKGAGGGRAICTHAILSGNAVEKVENSPMEELIVTDSIPHDSLPKKIHVLSCDKLFADVMRSVHEHASISNKFLM